MPKELTLHDLVVRRIQYLLTTKKDEKGKTLTSYRTAKNGNLSTRTLNNLLNGVYPDARLSTIAKICDGLGITLKEFFDDDLFNK
jgi:DNA-binding Xre family transcriptional regulator